MKLEDIINNKNIYAEITNSSVYIHDKASQYIVDYVELRDWNAFLYCLNLIKEKMGVEYVSDPVNLSNIGRCFSMAISIRAYYPIVSMDDEYIQKQAVPDEVKEIIVNFVNENVGKINRDVYTDSEDVSYNSFEWNEKMK